MNDIMSPSEQREFADRITDLRWERRQQRRARRRAFADFLLSIPGTALLRLGA
ncbi:hypothetical protein [Microbacterium stercoris]|uniref:Uncharacterized protein n=1 Tax=Microbacterium stercoris TaxID=2820289 RepID=A0A939QR18_9MICO|nr:hypothetical protein [Microbacterium stercoris]MBO3665125.1 hypothetical protein [Microbacterium stercoris]